MSDEELDNFVNGATDPEENPQAVDQETDQEEAAPLEDEGGAEDAEPEKEVPKGDGVQKRINQLTAEKHAERRRREEIEAKLELIQRQNQEQADKKLAPTLEAFDYDEAAYQEALIDYKVEQQAKRLFEQTRQQEQSAKAQARQQALNDEYNQRIEQFKEKTGAADFHEVAGSLTMIPLDLAETIMDAEDGPAIAYHLGQHLDLAEKIAAMSPTRAALELGKISVNLSAGKKKTTTKAPDPVKTVKGSGSTSKSYEDMSMEELMNTD